MHLALKFLYSVADINLTTTIRPKSYVYVLYKWALHHAFQGQILRHQSLLLGRAWASPTLAGLHCADVYLYDRPTVLAAIYRKF